LSKRLAELLGGEVRVSSTIREGSQFTVSIPRRFEPLVAAGETTAALLRAGEPLPATRPAVGTVAQPAEGTRPAILLIDDDDASRYLLRNALAEIELDASVAILEA